MKIHSTNYKNVFIEIADDCPVSAAVSPQQKTPKTVAEMQYEMISKNPYKYTSDDVIFETFALKNDITDNEKPAARNQFFSKGQACFRSSPLAKRYGFGFHHNSDGTVAIYPVESAEYQRFLNDENVKKVKAMRSKRA